MLRPSESQNPLYPLLVVVATLVVFGSLAAADFTSWDDPFNLWKNPHLNPPTLRGIAHYWTTPAYGLYIPLTYSVWGGLAKIAYLNQPDAMGAQLNPLVFHAANVALHMISAIVVFRILVLLMNDGRAACLGALLFALHPLQVESVAWCAGMKDVLSGMLGLVAVWQYILFAHHGIRGGASTPCPGVGSSWTHYAIATIALVIAMLAKPSAMVVPAIVLVIDALLIRRPLRSIVIPLLPWVVLSIACAILTKLNQPAIGVTPAPLWSRPLLALDSIAFYLFKLVWPIHLGIDYGRRPEVVIARGAIWFTWIVPIVVGVAITLSRKRRSELGASVLIFVAGIVPVLGLVTFLFQHFSTTADHYVYLAMLGVALAGAWVVRDFKRPVFVAVFSAIAALLGVRSILQTRVWQNDVTLFAHALEVNPRSFMAASNLGHAYLSRGDVGRAEELFQRSIELNDRFIDARENLAALLESTGRIAEAVEQREIALRLRAERPTEIQGDLASKRIPQISNLIQLGRLDEARRQLDLARREGGENPTTVQLLDELEEQIREAAGAPGAG